MNETNIFKRKANSRGWERSAEKPDMSLLWYLAS